MENNLLKRCEDYLLLKITECESTDIIFDLMCEYGYITDVMASQLSKSLFDRVENMYELDPVEQEEETQVLLSETAVGNLLLDLIFFRRDETPLNELQIGEGNTHLISNFEVASHAMHQTCSELQNYKHDMLCEPLQIAKYGCVPYKCCQCTVDYTIDLYRTFDPEGTFFNMIISYVIDGNGCWARWNSFSVSERPRPSNGLSFLGAFHEMRTSMKIGLPILWMMPRWTMFIKDPIFYERLDSDAIEMIGWYRVLQRLTGKRNRRTKTALMLCCTRFLVGHAWVGGIRHPHFVQVRDEYTVDL
jgi:hypothetical protein